MAGSGELCRGTHVVSGQAFKVSKTVRNPGVASGSRASDMRRNRLFLPQRITREDCVARRQQGLRHLRALMRAHTQGALRTSHLV